ncbi:MAG: acyl-CoA thioesterase [Paracoccaceae bacterium]|jgi:acyl-CoA thioesterase
MAKLSDQERAERTAAVMWENDLASQSSGMQIDLIGPGFCTTSMTVATQHLNGHGICHGGYIFMLADSAFAFACNSYNQLVVAQNNSINFVSPGRPSEVLIAKAKEISRSGRNGIYDVSVTGEGGRVIAEFRGCSRTIKGQHFEEIEG